MFSGPEGIIVLVLVLVLFGGSQLPKLARNLGRAQKEFKDGLEEANTGQPADKPADNPADNPAAGSAETPDDAAKQN